jgi:hypothetical protein
MTTDILVRLTDGSVFAKIENCEIEFWGDALDCRIWFCKNTALWDMNKLASFPADSPHSPHPTVEVAGIRVPVTLASKFIMQSVGSPQLLLQSGEWSDVSHETAFVELNRSLSRKRKP